MSDEEELSRVFRDIEVLSPFITPFARSARRMPPETVYTLVRMHVEEAMWHLLRATLLIYTFNTDIGGWMAVMAHATAAKTAGMLAEFEKFLEEKYGVSLEASRGGSEEEE